MKKNYVSPTMSVIIIKSRCRLLQGSDPTNPSQNPINNDPQGGDGD